MGETNKIQVAFLIIILIFMIAVLRLVYQVAMAYDAKFNGENIHNSILGEETRSSDMMKGLFAVLLFGLLGMLTYRYDTCSSDEE